MSCANRFGVGEDRLAREPYIPKDRKLELCTLSIFNKNASNLRWDFCIITEILKQLEADDQNGKKISINTSGKRYTSGTSHRFLTILRNITDILNILQTENESYVPWHLIKLSFYDKILQMTHSIIYKHKNGGSQLNVCCVGNCHIDTAWLWPYSVTRKKVIRSWASQLKLMQLYPEHQFTASQAQQFEWLLEDDPHLFSRIQNCDRFHIVGGTWIEMDGNLPSGESFVRQFLYGQRFFQKYFDRKCEIFWLPDTFGYSPQLPQIMRNAGINYFLTQKLSWNLINDFPHHTFLWQGLDGTCVLTHFPPADTYVSECRIKDITYCKDNYKNKSVTNDVIMLYGWGDGGGGPTTLHLERLKRCSNIDGIPTTEIMSPLKFFETKLKPMVYKMCHFSGELYFELHRGTYTSQALLKKYNRECEIMLHLTEFVHSILVIVTNVQMYEYPRLELSDIWKNVLLNQFHDVLPGSSIEIVNNDAREIYQQTQLRLTKVMTSGMNDLAMYFVNQNERKDGINVGACLVNNLSWKRREIVHVRRGDSSLISYPSSSVLTQTAYDNQTLVLCEIESNSIQVLSPVQSSTDSVSISYDDDRKIFVMENNTVYAEINCNGNLVSYILKKSGKQFIDHHSFGNHFLLYDDRPLFWDAWDVMLYHLQTETSLASNVIPDSLKIIEEGPLRCGLQFEVAINNPMPKSHHLYEETEEEKEINECNENGIAMKMSHSHITQQIFLTVESNALVFETMVDWAETHKILKVEFPLNIHANVCVYDMQFGYIRRSTHMNTTVDIAQFEVCAHKYALLEENRFACALVNDCKYGYSCIGNKLRLSLLRAPKIPDMKCDMHRHFFKYALVAYEDEPFPNNGIIQYSCAFNSPMKYASLGSTFQLNAMEISFVKLNTSQIILETIKVSEENEHELIFRLYEACGGECNLCVVSCNEMHFGGMQSAKICNLLEEVEEDEKDLLFRDNDENNCGWISFALHFQAFEIKSVKISFK